MEGVEHDLCAVDAGQPGIGMACQRKRLWKVLSIICVRQKQVRQGRHGVLEGRAVEGVEDDLCA